MNRDEKTKQAVILKLMHPYFGNEGFRLMALETLTV